MLTNYLQTFKSSNFTINIWKSYNSLKDLEEELMHLFHNLNRKMYINCIYHLDILNKYTYHLQYFV